MSGTNATVDTPETIEVDHPGWHVWRAKRGKDGKRGDEPGSWVATLIDPTVGTDPTVMAGTAEEMRRALADQRRRRGG